MSARMLRDRGINKEGISIELLSSIHRQNRSTSLLQGVCPLSSVNSHSYIAQTGVQSSVWSILKLGAIDGDIP